jgi:hypothetical protein
MNAARQEAENQAREDSRKIPRETRREENGMRKETVVVTGFATANINDNTFLMPISVSFECHSYQLLSFQQPSNDSSANSSFIAR